MKIHYFQRYHQKENVATANTMLLLSRLYSYSSQKFFEFLTTVCFSDSAELELIFTMQEKSGSIPDATITQNSFKVVVETKLSDWFYEEQLMNHLEAFKDEKYKVLLTLAPELMDKNKKEKIDTKIKRYNENKKYPVIHRNTTFEELSNVILEKLDERDFDMNDVLEDYLDYCYKDNLILRSDAWKYLRVQLAGTTFNFNLQNNIYYDKITRGFRAHDYLGLYRHKSVRAFGKVIAIITATMSDKGLVYSAELGDITEERKNRIDNAIEDARNYGYILEDHRYFFVDEFIEIDFNKTSPRAPMGTKIFNLTEELETDEYKDYPTKTIAMMLNNKSWE